MASAAVVVRLALADLVGVGHCPGIQVVEGLTQRLSKRRSVWVRTRWVTPSSRRLISLNRHGSASTAITIIDHLPAIWSRIGRLGQSALKTREPTASGAGVGAEPASMP
jgi:hypothetical protein